MKNLRQSRSCATCKFLLGAEEDGEKKYYCGQDGTPRPDLFEYAKGEKFMDVFTKFNVWNKEHSITLDKVCDLHKFVEE